jgi:hypothetical protein
MKIFLLCTLLFVRSFPLGDAKDLDLLISIITSVLNFIQKKGTSGTTEGMLIQEIKFVLDKAETLKRIGFMCTMIIPAE